MAAVAALDHQMDAATGMPTRVLGKTGRRVSVLMFGCGSRFLSYQDEDQAQAVLNEALAGGITYLDTAFDYGRGKSEERVGRAIQGRRDQVFVATKMPSRNGDAAMKIFEGSLKRLGTDHVDLVHMHALMGAEDLAAAEAKGGLIEMLYKVRDQKMARAIGVTCHAFPDVLATALERHDFDCTQMALNAARAGMITPAGKFTYTGPMAASFESVALPVALKKKMGVTAMKVFGQEALVGKATPEQLIRYSLSLPVTACVVGMPKREMLAENLTVAKGFRPMAAGEMQELSSRLAGEKAGMDRWFADHVDA
jgi:predicted aldo/keto reductase-like oxidoreductase